MSKKSVFYKTFFGRRNLLKSFILGFVFPICSWPRLVIEVFTRRNFGCRYFTSMSAATVFLILALIPILNGPYHNPFSHVLDILWDNILWYAYLAAFAFCAYQRAAELRRNPSVFDFGHFTLSAGEIQPNLTKLIPNIPSITIRQVEIIFEPLPFFAGGILLAALGQSLGFLLIFCSVVYSISYWAAYAEGDNEMMDRIDDIICGEELKNIIVNRAPIHETRGVKINAQLPKNAADAEKLAEYFMDDNDDGRGGRATVK